MNGSSYEIVLIPRMHSTFLVIPKDHVPSFPDRSSIKNEWSSLRISYQVSHAVVVFLNISKERASRPVVVTVIWLTDDRSRSSHNVEARKILEGEP